MRVYVRNMGGTPIIVDAVLFDANGNIINGAGKAASFASVVPQGRLTLTSGVAITTSDVTGATTLYYTPTVGRWVPIYNGTTFINTDIAAELSNITTNSATGNAGPAAVGNNLIYDLYVWNDAGTVRLTRSPAWASDTSRGTGAGTAEIEQLQGIWVNKVAITNGPAAQLGTLVGSVRSDGTAQLRDTFAFRWVSNIYNAVPRPMRNANETTDNWVYSTATFRQANANTANQLDWLHALSGGMISANVFASASNSVAGVSLFSGIGIDSTTVNSAINTFAAAGGAGVIIGIPSAFRGFAAQGRHFAAWLEIGGAAGATAFYGDGGLTGTQSGIVGEVWN